MASLGRPWTRIKPCVWAHILPTHLCNRDPPPALVQEPFIELMQNSSPKVDVATLAPATYPENPDNEWYGGSARGVGRLPASLWPASYPNIFGKSGGSWRSCNLIEPPPICPLQLPPHAPPSDPTTWPGQIGPCGCPPPQDRNNKQIQN